MFRRPEPINGKIKLSEPFNNGRLVTFTREVMQEPPYDFGGFGSIRFGFSKTVVIALLGAGSNVLTATVMFPAEAPGFNPRTVL